MDRGALALQINQGNPKLTRLPDPGAAASVTRVKQRRLIFAARHYLMRYATPPPCRFDVVAMDGEEINWLQAAFDAE